MGLLKQSLDQVRSFDVWKLALLKVAKEFEPARGRRENGAVDPCSEGEVTRKSEYRWLAQGTVPSKRANSHMLYRCLHVCNTRPQAGSPKVPAIIVPFRQNFWKLFLALVTNASLS